MMNEIGCSCVRLQYVLSASAKECLNYMQKGVSFSEVSTAKTVTTRLARSEQQASQNYETAVVPNKNALRSKTLKGLGAKVAVREECVECVQ